MIDSVLHYALFTVFILAMLAVDLGVFHRKAETPTFKQATAWTIVWVSLALAFFAGVCWQSSMDDGLAFLTGYLVELSLSVDNLFVFILIFTYFAVPPAYQHRVLFWGILGALVMRGVFIGLGALLIAKFHWIIYVFGAFILFTGVKMFFAGDGEIHPEKNPLLTFLRRILRITPEYYRDRFAVVIKGKYWFTPLFLVLVLIEATDVVFALDSIPAIFGITKKPFIVYTSNIFAILGLRSLYFLLAGMMGMFEYLKHGVAVVLVFVGVKMCGEALFEIGNLVSLLVIALILCASIALSIHAKRKRDAGGPQA